MGEMCLENKDVIFMFYLIRCKEKSLVFSFQCILSIIFSECSPREREKISQSNKHGVNGKKTVLSSCITLFTETPELNFIYQESKKCKGENWFSIKLIRSNQ